MLRKQVTQVTIGDVLKFSLLKDNKIPARFMNEIVNLHRICYLLEVNNQKQICKATQQLKIIETIVISKNKINQIFSALTSVRDSSWTLVQFHYAKYCIIYKTTKIRDFFHPLLSVFSNKIKSNLLASVLRNNDRRTLS